MTSDAAAPDVLVVGAGAAAAGIAARLTGRGALVGRVEPGDDLDEVAIDAVVAELGAPSLVVLAHLDPAASRPRPLVDLDDGGWDAAGERSVRVALRALQGAHRHLPDGGRVVVVLPSVATIGVPGLVPMCTAVEAMRVMAKVAARRWGARGITVNVVLVPLDAFVGDLAPEGLAVPSLGPAALGERDALDDAVGLIEALRGPGGGGLTGATLGADGGTVMVP